MNDLEYSNVSFQSFMLANHPSPNLAVWDGTFFIFLSVIEITTLKVIPTRLS